MVPETPADPGCPTELTDLRAQVEALRAAVAGLEQRDLHLRAAMQASNVVAYRWDIVRDRVCRLRSSSEPGQALEDAGTFEEVVAKVLAEDQAQFRADITAALASDEGLYRTELRYRRPDGEVRWISESGRVLRDDSGRPTTMVGITFDITDRKHAEQALQQAEAQLRQQAQRKDRFLAVLAHELRNPLAPIRNATHILRRMNQADAKLGRTCDVIDRQVGQLVRLVDDLLDVSRISSGKLVLQRQRVDLRDIAQQGLETSQARLSARGHAVELSLPAEPVPVVGDAARLVQVVTNLLNNAAKYTDPGGQVALSVTCEADVAVVGVRDNGRGLEAAEQERVFDMFFQVAGDLEHSEGGLGLGLSLVKNLVELHGGTVHAHSPGRGHGSLFSLRLPLATASVHASGQPLLPGTITSSARG